MFSELALVKSEEQYRDYVSEIAKLISADPDPGSPEGKRLELLSFLVEAYEKDRYQLPLPNPVDAILFRLEQKGMRQQDLAPILGSKSRVSEVLSGKRRLTVSMIRGLSAFLDIPVEALVAEPQKISASGDENQDPPLALVKEIVKRGWVRSGRVTPKSAREFVDQLFERLGSPTVAPTYLRTSLHPAVLKSKNLYAIRLWLARVVLKSRELNVRGKFDRNSLHEGFLVELAKLSWFADGPRLAKEYLAKHGIAVVVEEHLPGTCLDGAATIDIDGTPIIGLTLRHDRLDSFWFTLLHECVHVVYHLRTPGETYVDDTEKPFDTDEKEVEANRLARDTLIPPQAWRRSEASRLKSTDAASRLADELKISPAIVAGRIRRETGNYKLLSSMVGYGQVSQVLGQQK